MPLHTPEWILLLTIIAMSLYSLWESDKVKSAITSGKKTKVRAYQEAMLFMWVPTLLLLAFISQGALSTSSMGLNWQGNLSNWSGAAIVLAIFAYFSYSAYTVLSSSEKLAEFRDAAQQHSWMVPANGKELRWFTFGLSVSAGVCEELLFRGFIIGVLGDTFGVIASLLASSLLFGLCHFYNGWINVLRTALIGLVLGIIFILTESLWVVITLHALIDIYGGIIGYAMHNAMPVGDEPREALL